MKKVLVYNVAAELGGALTILQAFYDYVSMLGGDTHWYFVVSKPQLRDTNNITILRYPNVKKSWIHRLVFDYFHVKRIVEEIEPDVIFSMQNLTIPGINIPQVLYVHQPIPFTAIRFSLFESKYHWAYQNLISKLIYQSIKKAEHVIVQTKWMAESVTEKTMINTEKLSVILPEIPSLSNLHKYNHEGARKTFFYPVSFIRYKNHKVIIDAINELEKKGDYDFHVLFTGEKNEADLLGLDCNNQRIKIIGKLKHDEVIDIMCKSTLVFPSKLETFGLPMLEAKICKAFVLAGDTEFAHDILDGYENAQFFDIQNASELADKMHKIITGDMPYTEVKDVPLSEYKIGWEPIVDILMKY